MSAFFFTSLQGRDSVFGHDSFTHFYSEMSRDSVQMMNNARWKDWSVDKWAYAKNDDDGIYQGRSFWWNLCGGSDYEIAQGVYQRSLTTRSDGVTPKREKIVTWIRDYTGDDTTNGSRTFETIKTFTHTQNYHFPMQDTEFVTYNPEYNVPCQPELDSMEGNADIGCFSDHNRTIAANDQAKKAIEWLENKFPDKVCKGDETIRTVGPAPAPKTEDEEEVESTEEPTNKTGLYLLIGGVVVVGGVIIYQMS